MKLYRVKLETVIYGENEKEANIVAHDMINVSGNEGFIFVGDIHAVNTEHDLSKVYPVAMHPVTQTVMFGGYKIQLHDKTIGQILKDKLDERKAAFNKIKELETQIAELRRNVLGEING